MRLVARFLDERQASSLVDTLRKEGFDRDDMIISSLWEDQKYNTVEEAAEEISFIKTERNGLGEIETFGDGIKNLTSNEGVIVAVKTPKHESDRVRSFMEQSGAIEIIQD